MLETTSYKPADIPDKGREAPAIQRWFLFLSVETLKDYLSDRVLSHHLIGYYYCPIGKSSALA
jgi:hypothetical protein